MSETTDAKMMENIFIEELKPDIQAVIAKHEEREQTNGRPSKMSAVVIESILRSLSRGVPKVRAVTAAGISPRSWNTWQDDYPEIEELFDRAKAFSVEQLASEIREGVDIKGNPDWKARAWILERIDKENYSAPKPDTIVTVNNNSLTVIANPQAQQLAQTMHEQAIAAIVQQRQQGRLITQVSPDSHAHALPVSASDPARTEG